MLKRCAAAALAAAFVSLAGGATMTAQDKKDPPKKEAPKKGDKDADYTEKVAVRKWVESSRTFLNPNREIDAFRKDVKGETVICVRKGTGAGALPYVPTKGSEITDAEGKVYVVGKVVEAAMFGPFYHQCHVTEKK